MVPKIAPDLLIEVTCPLYSFENLWFHDYFQSRENIVLIWKVLLCRSSSTSGWSKISLRPCLSWMLLYRSTSYLEPRLLLLPGLDISASDQPRVKQVPIPISFTNIKLIDVRVYGNDIDAIHPPVPWVRTHHSDNVLSFPSADTGITSQLTGSYQATVESGGAEQCNGTMELF